MNMKLKFFIAGAAIVAGLASAVSCQDISKDLTALQDKVKSLESTVQSLQQKIDAGAVITSVTPTNSGIVITLSNGNKYEITNGVNGKDGSNGTNGKDGKDGKDGSVVTIGENGNWFIDGEDTGLAAQGPAGEDGVFYVPNPETGCFDMWEWNAETETYDVTPTEISFLAPGTITAVYDPETGVLTLFNVEGGEGELGIVTIGGTASEVATIELFDYTPYDPTTPATAAATIETFSYTTIGQNTTFVKGVPGAIEFVKNSQVQRPTDVVVVRVTPANYELKAEDIVLVNTAGTVFEQAVVSEVKRHKDVSTKATTTTGLWDVKFELTNYNATAFNNATTKSGKKILFAVKAGESVTNFDMAFDATTITPLGYDGATAATKLENNLYLDTDATLVSSIADRNGAGAIYTYQELEWTGGPQYTVVKPTSTTATPNTATAAVRTGAGYYNAVIGTPIKIYSKSNEVKALYVRLDTENAVGSGYPDVSEINAWKSYSYTGIDQVVEGKEVSISINSEAAKGDYIGFRVFAVNWNGTLIDPDGCAFYVQVGNPGSDWSGVTTVMSKPEDYVAGHSAFTAVKSAKLATAATYTFTMDDSKAPVFNLTVAKSASSPLVVDPTATTPTTIITPTTTPVAVPTTWKLGADSPDFKGVWAVPALPTVAMTDYKDDQVYTGTLKIYDASNFVLATLKVGFQKVVPTTAPSGYSIKTGQLDASGVYNCYLVPFNTTTWAEDWTVGNADYGTMTMKNVFNFPTVAGTDVSGNYLIIFNDADEYTPDGTNYYPTYSIASGAGDALIANKLANLKTQIIDNKTQHITMVMYNYGLVSSVKNATGGYDPTMIPVDSFPTVFNCIYNDKYVWDWHWGTNDPTAKPPYYAYNAVWATEIAAKQACEVATAAENEAPQIVYENFDNGKLNYKWVAGNCGWDSKYTATLNAPYNSSLRVDSAKLTSDANGVEEYYKVYISTDTPPAPYSAPAAGTFLFVKQSGASNPTTAVPSTLTLKCKDMYNHDVTIKLPVKVMPRK